MSLARIGARSTASTVHFARPFQLGRDARELPAGTYAISTQEDVFQGMTGQVAVATSVDLMVEDGATRATRIVRPSDLRDALARDEAGPTAGHGGDA